MYINIYIFISYILNICIYLNFNSVQNWSCFLIEDLKGTDWKNVPVKFVLPVTCKLNFLFLFPFVFDFLLSFLATFLHFHFIPLFFLSFLSSLIFPFYHFLCFLPSLLRSFLPSFLPDNFPWNLFHWKQNKLLQTLTLILICFELGHCVNTKERLLATNVPKVDVCFPSFLLCLNFCPNFSKSDPQ